MMGKLSDRSFSVLLQLWARLRLRRSALLPAPHAQKLHGTVVKTWFESLREAQLCYLINFVILENSLIFLNLISSSEKWG